MKEKISLSSENSRSTLRQNAIDDMAVDIREPPPDTVVVERQLCVVDAH
jgi:hypothetical protein